MNEENKNKIECPLDQYGRPIMGPHIGRQFSKDYQPTKEQRSAGQIKRRIFKEMMSQPLVKNESNKKYIEMAAKYLQIPEDEITWPDIMHFAQIRKAVSKADTFAYVAVMDRIEGKPVSKMTLANDEDNPITPLDQNQVNDILIRIKAGGVGEGLNVGTSNIEDAQIVEDQNNK